TAGEDALGMLAGKGATAAGGAGLVQYRRPLQRWLAQMDGVGAEEFAIELHLVHLGGIAEPALHNVATRGIVFPTAFPQAIHHFHISLGDIVARVIIGDRPVPAALPALCK